MPLEEVSPDVWEAYLLDPEINELTFIWYDPDQPGKVQWEGKNYPLPRQQKSALAFGPLPLPSPLGLHRSILYLGFYNRDSRCASGSHGETGSFLERVKGEKARRDPQQKQGEGTQII